jgi:hypothetical protein
MIKQIIDTAKEFFNEELFEVSDNKFNKMTNDNIVIIREPQNPSNIVEVHYDSNITMIILDPENKFFSNIFDNILNSKSLNKNKRRHKRGDAVIIWGSNNKIYIGIFELKTTIGFRTFRDVLKQIQNTLLGVLLILRFLKGDLIDNYYAVIAYDKIKISDTEPVEYDPYINPYDPILDNFIKQVSNIFDDIDVSQEGIEFKIKFPGGKTKLPVKFYKYRETFVYLTDYGMLSGSIYQIENVHS